MSVTSPIAIASDLPSSVRVRVGRVHPAGGDPAAVARHLDELAKPPGALGRLEDVALRLALIHGDPPPPLTRRCVFVLAGDHGVARRGVSAYPAEVTAQMCHSLAAGNAAVTVLARATGTAVVVADLGVDADLAGLPGLVGCKVRRGSRDFVEEAALTPAEAEQAIAAGAALVAERAAAGLDVVALGEMGIGNTTSASALTAALIDLPPAAVLGRGTGVDDAAFARKAEAVGAALARVGPGRSAWRLLVELGGLEIAALVGVTLEAAARRRPVVTDGFIATAAALVAVRLCPPAHDYLFASHRSPEPGHGILLRALGLEPLLDLGMRLGEGTGAVLALPLLDAAGALLREMATFTSAGVSGRCS